MPDTTTMLHLATGYGYPVVAALLLVASAGLPLPVTVLLVALGMLSGQTNQLDFTTLAIAGTLASVAGDLLDYAAGRLGMDHLPAPLRRVMDRHPAGAGRVSALMARNSGMAIFLTRCLLTPFAAPVSLLAGAARLRLRTFLFWDLAGEAVFVAGYLVLGRFLGAVPGPFAALPWAALILAGILALAPLTPLALPTLRRFFRTRTPATPNASAYPLGLPAPHAQTIRSAHAA